MAHVAFHPVYKYWGRISSIQIFQDSWKLSDCDTEIFIQILILAVVLIIDRICLLSM